jgi:hypothetical protein
VKKFDDEMAELKAKPKKAKELPEPKNLDRLVDLAKPLKPSVVAAAEQHSSSREQSGAEQGRATRLLSPIAELPLTVGRQPLSCGLLTLLFLLPLGVCLCVQLPSFSVARSSMTSWRPRKPNWPRRAS